MERTVLAGIFAGITVAGLILSPILAGSPQTANAFNTELLHDAQG